jgi:hypothetical protein
MGETIFIIMWTMKKKLCAFINLLKHALKYY